MKRPNDETWFARRASKPSNQSVNAEAMNSQKAHVAAHNRSVYIRPTTTNIMGTRESVSTLGKVNFTRPIQTTAPTLASTGAANPFALVRLPLAGAFARRDLTQNVLAIPAGRRLIVPTGRLAGREIQSAGLLRREAPRNDNARMKLCIYPGTFDPFTNGHLDVLQRAAKLFGHVRVAVAIDSTKKPLFSPEKRVELIRGNLRGLPNVDVVSFDGLLVEFARRERAAAIIRGLRALSDFEFEFNMALMNRHLEPKVETIFVMPKESYSYTSSSLVKQIAKLGGDVSKFVPANVAKALRKTYAR
jgi:pantetheine-phosphate adenylyltransferase